jgi:hypothetical protein
MSFYNRFLLLMLLVVSSETFAGDFNFARFRINEDYPDGQWNYNYMIAAISTEGQTERKIINRSSHQEGEVTELKLYSVPVGLSGYASNDTNTHSISWFLTSNEYGTGGNETWLNYIVSGGGGMGDGSGTVGDGGEEPAKQFFKVSELEVLNDSQDHWEFKFRALRPMAGNETAKEILETVYETVYSGQTILYSSLFEAKPEEAHILEVKYRVIEEDGTPVSEYEIYDSHQSEITEETEEGIFTEVLATGGQGLLSEVYINDNYAEIFVYGEIWENLVPTEASETVKLLRGKSIQFDSGRVASPPYSFSIFASVDGIVYEEIYSEDSFYLYVEEDFLEIVTDGEYLVPEDESLYADDSVWKKEVLEALQSIDSKTTANPEETLARTQSEFDSQMPTQGEMDSIANTTVDMPVIPIAAPNMPITGISGTTIVLGSRVVDLNFVTQFSSEAYWLRAVLYWIFAMAFFLLVSRDIQDALQSASQVTPADGKTSIMAGAVFAEVSSSSPAALLNAAIIVGVLAVLPIGLYALLDTLGFDVSVLSSFAASVPDSIQLGLSIVDQFYPLEFCFWTFAGYGVFRLLLAPAFLAAVFIIKVAIL